MGFSPDTCFMSKKPSSNPAPASKKAATKDGLAFESLLAELDATVQKMESGQLSLEESLSCFERGMALTRQCQAILSEAEQRIEKLMQELPDAQ